MPGHLLFPDAQPAPPPPDVPAARPAPILAAAVIVAPLLQIPFAEPVRPADPPPLLEHPLVPVPPLGLKHHPAAASRSPAPVRALPPIPKIGAGGVFDGGAGMDQEEGSQAHLGAGRGGSQGIG